jgi:hypothetical protein
MFSSIKIKAARELQVQQFNLKVQLTRRKVRMRLLRAYGPVTARASTGPGAASECHILLPEEESSGNCRFRQDERELL